MRKVIYHTGLLLGLAEGFGHTPTQMLFVRRGGKQLNHHLGQSEFPLQFLLLTSSLPQKLLSCSLNESNYRVNAMQRTWESKYPKRYSRPENKWINENAAKISHNLIQDRKSVV